MIANLLLREAEGEQKLQEALLHVEIIQKHFKTHIYLYIFSKSLICFNKKSIWFSFEFIIQFY